MLYWMAGRQNEEWNLKMDSDGKSYNYKNHPSVHDRAVNQLLSRTIEMI